MTALGPSDMSARKRPFVVLALAGLRAVAGLCLAWPLASLVADSGIGLRAEGDRALFEGGGYLLLELLRLQGGSLMAVARGLMPIFLVGLLLTTAANGALLVALNTRERLKSVDWLGRTRARLPSLLVLGAGTALAQLLLLGCAALAAGAITDSLAHAQRSSALQLAVWALAVCLAGGLGGFADVTKASLVRYEAPLTEALSRSWAGFRRHPALACFGWLPYALGLLLAAAAAAELTQRCDVSRAGSWRIAAVFVLHQLVVVTSVAARAGWFARALRLTASQA